MIWKAKYAKQGFEERSLRLKRVFAWTPTRINDDIIWLQTYEILQVFITEAIEALNENKPVVFKISRWVDVDKRFIK